MSFPHGFRLALIAAVAALATFSSPAWSADAAKEKELIATLQSDSPPGDKALACKKLAVIGSEACVPELAKLLGNEQLASWARIPLEAIPGPAADKALRDALPSLKGKLLIGTINSIGVRKDAAASEALASLVKDTDADVASSAAVALGQIGDAAAAKSLGGSLASAPPAVRSAVAEGLILCGERAMREGRDADAVAIYDQVRKADVPHVRVVEATRGAILSRKDDGIPLLLETLASPDKQLFYIGLSTAREMSGGKVDTALVEWLRKAAPERASLVVAALADRKSTAVVGALVDGAQKGPKSVRVASIAALGRVGNVSCFGTLLDAATDSDADISAAAKKALAELADPEVNKTIIAQLGKPSDAFPVLIEIAGIRRVNAVTDLFKAADHKDGKIRLLALTALGNTIPQKDLGRLISIAINTKNADESAAALDALKAASVRMPDREACAEELAKAIERAPKESRGSLLQIVGAVGGTKALATVYVAAKSSDATLQDVSSRILGEWSTIDAAPVLLDLAKSAPGDKYQTRALRGYIRIARQFVMPDAQRVEMCEKAWGASEQVAEKKLVIEILKRYPSVGTLRLAAKAAETPAVKDEANAALLVIAQKIGAKDPAVVDLVAKVGLTKVKLEIVKAEYGAGSQVKDVTAVLRKHAADTALVALPNANYNEAFGGDPASGVVKQLKVQYKINGKSSEATFAENALIILP